jgi:hypothetical protein
VIRTGVFANRISFPSNSTAPNAFWKNAVDHSLQSFSTQCHPWTFAPSARSSTIHRELPSPILAISSFFARVYRLLSRARADGRLSVVSFFNEEASFEAFRSGVKP